MLHEQIGIGPLVESINFLGDHDKNLTELCIPEMHVRWILVQLSKIKKERILGEQYIGCNPFNPCLDDSHLMTEEVKAGRKPRYVKKILDQWYACAKRSQSEAISNLYSQLLVRVVETGKHLCEHLVFKIEVDPTLSMFPKVYSTAAEGEQKVKLRFNKRRAGEQNGPAARTPISAARKRKGGDRNGEDNGMYDISDSDTSREDGSTREDIRSMVHKDGGQQRNIERQNGGTINGNAEQ